MNLETENANLRSDIVAYLERLKAAAGQNDLSLASAWFSEGWPLSAYCRIQFAVVENKRVQVLCLANVGVEEEYQGRGYVGTLLSAMETVGLPVYIEEIINPQMEQMAQRRGYVLHRRDWGGTPSYIKLIPAPILT